MTQILEIALSDFRNMENARLNLSPTINFIFGANGAGKSSLLEAIYCLGNGKSFRSSDHLNLIRDQQLAFVMHARVNLDGRAYALGLSRNRNGAREARIDANPASLAGLAACLPTILLSSFSYLFYTGGPKARRHFLDWLTFHVKHEFYAASRDFQGLLKQRNKALKQRLSAREVGAWDAELAIQAEKIHLARVAAFESLKPVFLRHAQAVLPAKQIKLEYQRGWPQESQLDSQLKEHLARDYQLGYTELGPQRADLSMNLGAGFAGDMLSQGQQKMAIFALQLAMGECLHLETGKKAVYLLDDLASELDIQNRQRLITELESLQAQMIVTGIELEELSQVIESRQAKLFNVAAGKIEERVFCSA